MGCVRDTRAYKCHMAAEIVFVRACGCNLSLSFTALLCEIRALKSLGQPYTQHGAHLTKFSRIDASLIHRLI